MTASTMNTTDTPKSSVLPSRFIRAHLLGVRHVQAVHLGVRRLGLAPHPLQFLLAFCRATMFGAQHRCPRRADGGEPGQYGGDGCALGQA